LGRILIALAGLAALACLGFHFRVGILRELADIWIVNEPVGKADAIVILGGGLENRPLAAARMFHEGIAPKILYMDVQLTPTAELGITLPEREATRRMLLSNGVPESAMETIGNSVANTYDESQAVRAWMDKTGAKSIVIPTDIFHTRRARMIFRKELAGEHAEIHVVPVKPIGYGEKDWWLHEQGLISFENEVIKYAYYRMKY
jgi:uncharacterized SAM-binding protein YcdF (DUF218 family)